MMEYLAKFLPYMLQSTVMTLKIFVLTLAIALPLGLPIALGSNCRIRPLAWLCRLYVLIFRGTPLMLQLSHWDLPKSRPCWILSCRRP